MMNIKQNRYSAQETALYLLSRYAYSQVKLQQKLRQKGYQAEEITAAIQHALAEQWLDDDKYAQHLVNKLCQKGYGPNYIRQYLQSKGIASELAEQVLQREHWDWFAAVQRAHQRKYKGLSAQDWQQKRQQQAYLYRRGFDSELIHLCLAANASSLSGID